MPSLADPIAAESVLPGDPFAVLYTSGTTGPSKGVICPHAQYYWWGHNSAALLEVQPDDVLCTTLPLFHINALNTLAQALLTGAHMVLERRFSASGFWPAMAECGATVVYLLGAMVPILLAQPAGPAERAHRVRRGLGPGVPPDLMATFTARTGVALVDGYGSTETNFVIGTTAAERRPGTMGRIRPGFEAIVADEHDNPLPAEHAGELLLRAHEPFAFAAGYFGRPEQTVEAWRNLWFHTGDRVARDADGNFRFIDRLKDVIRRRGENISSHEVEQVLLSHPDIAAAAAFPVASDLAEDEVMAAVTLRPATALDPIALMRFCETRMPHFAIPRYVEVVADLPRTENGKIQKFKLRERGVTPATWDREAAGYRIRRPDPLRDQRSVFGSNRHNFRVSIENRSTAPTESRVSGATRPIARSPAIRSITIVSAPVGSVISTAASIVTRSDPNRRSGSAMHSGRIPSTTAASR